MEASTRKGRCNKQLDSVAKRKPPSAGRGRKVGEVNKLTRDAKQAFQFAFDKIGGAEQLAAWATENTTDFYKLFARMIPVDNRHSDADGKALNFTLYVPSKQ